MVIVTLTLNTSVDRTLEVPGFAVGGHLKGRLVRVQPAGKGINVSRCLARFGVPSVVTGFVGVRERVLFEDSLADSPAMVDLVPVADATRINTTILDPEADTDTHIRESGFRVGSDELTALALKLSGLASADAVFVVCGSLPPGVSASDLAGLLGVCRRGGGRLVADLNGSELGVAMDAGAFAMTPNVEELGEVLGRDLRPASEAELLAAARELCDRVETVLVTRGCHGALAVRRDEAHACVVDTGPPRNTVGCGDAFLAGYLAALWRGDPLSECLCHAVACGSANALTQAAGDIEPDQVADLAARARLRRLA